MIAQRSKLAVVAAALALLLISQALATASMPASQVGVAETTGRAAFAYLGSLRKFAAAVLWNRLEPQFHDYYSGGVADHAFMLPTLVAVQALDPQYVQSYYVSAYLLTKVGDPEMGIAVAREGVRNNPRSGLLRANLAQLLYLNGDAQDYDELAEHVSVGLSGDVEWDNDTELFESLAIFRDVARMFGDEQSVERIVERMNRLKGQDPADVQGANQ